MAVTPKTVALALNEAALLHRCGVERPAIAGDRMAELQQGAERVHRPIIGQLFTPNGAPAMRGVLIRTIT
jgi:hypothetical protein